MEGVRKWAIAAAVRAVKSGAQAVITLVGADMVNIVTLDWAQILGCVATMMVLSVCMSIVGVPEVEEGASALKIAKRGSDHDA